MFYVFEHLTRTCLVHVLQGCGLSRLFETSILRLLSQSSFPNKPLYLMLYQKVVTQAVEMSTDVYHS